MRSRFTPRFAGGIVAMVAFALGGCATAPTSATGNSNQAVIEHRRTVLVEMSGVTGPSAEIFVNDEPKGFMPVRVVLPVDEFGNVMRDVEITARWEDGRSDSYNRIPQGSPPPVVVRFAAGSVRSID